MWVFLHLGLKLGGDGYLESKVSGNIDPNNQLTHFKKKPKSANYKSVLFPIKLQSHQNQQQRLLVEPRDLPKYVDEPK